MYSTIKQYIKDAISDLKEFDFSIDLDLLPLNQMDSYYFIKFENIEDDNFESSGDTVTINIEFWFLLANRNDNYEKAIDKINEIKQNLKALAPYENSVISLNSISNIKVNNLNNIVKGNWLKPNIIFELKIMEY